VLVLSAYSRKKVLIVYSQDNELHRQVVHCFVHFLQRHCNVQVDVDYNDVDQIAIDRAKYIVGSVRSADKVLLIVSDGVRRCWQSEDAHADPDPDGGIIDIYLSMIRQIGVTKPVDVNRRRLVAVRFDYAGRNDKVDRENTFYFHRPIRELMKDLDQLVMDLHDDDDVQMCCVTKYISSWLFPVWYGAHYVECSEGEQLAAAIDQARTTVISRLSVKKSIKQIRC